MLLFFLKYKNMFIFYKTAKIAAQQPLPQLAGVRLVRRKPVSRGTVVESYQPLLILKK
jgi:hypothetical protein